jgi:hypothetical protein
MVGCVEEVGGRMRLGGKWNMDKASFLAQMVSPHVGGALWERGKRAGDRCVRGVLRHPALMGYLRGFCLRLQGLEEDFQGWQCGVGQWVKKTT